MRHATRRLFYGLASLLVDRILHKGHDYESLDEAYRIAWELNWRLFCTARFLGIWYPNQNRVKRLINNRTTVARFKLAKTDPDWRLGERNPQNKIQDLWSNDLP